MPCGVEVRAAKKRGDAESFIAKSKALHGDRYLYHLVDYKTDKIKVTLVCAKHDKPFRLKPNYHLNNLQGCPVCSYSKGELAISRILDKHGVRYWSQYKIAAINVRLRYDFYLSDQNLFIEFHGVQHFKPTYCWRGEEGFAVGQKNDAIKRDMVQEVRSAMAEFTFKHLLLPHEEFEAIVMRIVRRREVDWKKLQARGRVSNLPPPP